MIRAFARASVVLDEPRYLEAAKRAADFVLEEMRTDEGLLRRWREDGGRDEALLEALKGTVKGIALGIQNTG